MDSKMREWEIVLNGKDMTGLTVLAETEEDACMQARARLPQYWFASVRVRNLNDPIPKYCERAPLSETDLARFGASLGDPASLVAWEVFVRDCDTHGMPIRATGLKVMSTRHDDAFVRANMLLPRLHPEMLCVRRADEPFLNPPPKPWSPEQVARIVEIFGPPTVQAPALRWEIAIRDVRADDLSFMRGTGIPVFADTLAEAFEQARAQFPRLPNIALDVCDHASLQHPPWSPEQVKQLIENYGPIKPAVRPIFEWEVLVAEVTPQAFYILKGTCLKVLGEAREDAIDAARTMFPLIRPEMIDVRRLYASWSNPRLADGRILLDGRLVWSDEQVQRMLAGVSPNAPTLPNRHCERDACSKVLCDRLILEGSCYLCDDCYQELLEAKKHWPPNTTAWRVRLLIEEFLRRFPPNILVYPDCYLSIRKTVDEEFERLTSTKGVHDGKGA